MTARDNDTKIFIKPAQARAARALIGWSQDELVAFSSIPKSTIVRFEASIGTPRPSTLTALRAALEEAGIEFIGETGVRLLGPASQALRKREAEKQRQREAEDPYIPEVKFTPRDGIDLEAPSAPPPSSPKGKEK